MERLRTKKEKKGRRLAERGSGREEMREGTDADHEKCPVTPIPASPGGPEWWGTHSFPSPGRTETKAWVMQDAWSPNAPFLCPASRGPEGEGSQQNLS